MNDSSHQAETVEAPADAPPAEPDIHSTMGRLAALADEQRAAAESDSSAAAAREPVAHAETRAAETSDIVMVAADALAHKPDEPRADHVETFDVDIAAHVAAALALADPPAAAAAPAEMPGEVRHEGTVAPAPVEMSAPAEPAIPVAASTAVPIPDETAHPAAAAMVIPLVAATASPAAAPGSRVARTIDRLVTVMGALLPYALVAIGLRLVMARVFFLSGQSKIEGPVYPIEVPGVDLLQGFGLNVTLPTAVKESTYAMFAQMANLPIPSWIAAPVVSYAEFVLPICLVLGFGARFAALALLIMTVVIQAFVLPQALWTTHIYWAAILLVLISLGPGAVSIDHVIRRLYKR